MVACHAVKRGVGPFPVASPAPVALLFPQSHSGRLTRGRLALFVPWCRALLRGRYSLSVVAIFSSIISAPHRFAGATFKEQSFKRRTKAIILHQFLLKGGRMHRFFPPVLSCRAFALRLLLACCLVAALAVSLHAQSTFGSFWARCATQAARCLKGAQVTLVNTGTTAARSAVTDASGNYAFKNIDVGTYKVTIAAPGFQTESLPEHCPHSARNAPHGCRTQTRRRNPDRRRHRRRPRLSSPPTFRTSPKPRSATNWSSSPSPSTRVPPAPPAPSPRLPLKRACRPTMAATSPSWEPPLHCSASPRRHLQRRRRVLRPRQRNVSLLQFH